jgi:hypothetical protein
MFRALQQRHVPVVTNYHDIPNDFVSSQHWVEATVLQIINIFRFLSQNCRQSQENSITIQQNLISDVRLERNLTFFCNLYSQKLYVKEDMYEW